MYVNPKKIGLLCFLFCSSITLFAQNKGKVNFIIYPTNAFVKVNGQVYDLSENNTISLKEGSYWIQIWAPKRAISNDSITVTANNTLRYRKGLSKLSDEFIVYKEGALKIYNRKKMTRASVGTGVIAASGIASYFILRKDPKIKNYKEIAITDKRKYDATLVSYRDFIDSRESYYFHKNLYDDAVSKHNKKVSIGIPIVVTSTVLTGTILIALKKLERPLYNESNPLVDKSIIIEPSIGYNNAKPQFKLKLTF